MSVKCLICGEEGFGHLYTHLKCRHGMDAYAYEVMFPSAKTISDETREALSEGTMGV